MRQVKLIISFIFKFQWITFLYNYIIFKYNKISYSQFPNIYGRVKIICKGNLKIGGGVIFNSGKHYNPIGGDTILRLYIINKNARLTIGNNVGISNSTIFCSNSITIEDNVLIGGSCKLYDTDFHSIDLISRVTAFNQQIQDKEAKTSPIIIKKGAWIGGHCIILKGITIGSNSIIGAGSVVSKDIPDNEIWAGNPIRCLRKLEPIKHL